MVTITGIKLSPKTIQEGFLATVLKDAHCVKLIKKMFFLGWGEGVEIG